MAVYYKPQSPIQSGEDFIYPITTADQVKVDKDTRLNAVGVYLKNIDNSTDTTVYGNNATTLGGVAAEDYALKTDTAPDSSKLGGKAPEYYIQPRNLLDNSDFRNPVNQRGATAYNVDSQAYTLDRWEMTSVATPISNMELNSDNSVYYIALSASYGHYFQKIEGFSRYVGKTLTFAMECNKAPMGNDLILLINTGITQEAVKLTNGLNIVKCLIPEGATALYVGVQNNSSDTAIAFYPEWAALYEGSYTAETLPPYVPKGYAAELAECQRYYRKSYVGSSIPTFADGGVVALRPANTNWLCTVVFDKPMRIAPTVTVYSTKSKAAGKVTRFSDDVDIDVTILEDENGFCCLKNSAFDVNLAYYFSYTASADL